MGDWTLWVTSFACAFLGAWSGAVTAVHKLRRGADAVHRRNALEGLMDAYTRYNAAFFNELHRIHDFTMHVANPREPLDEETLREEAVYRNQTRFELAQKRKTALEVLEACKGRGYLEDASGTVSRGITHPPGLSEAEPDEWNRYHDTRVKPGSDHIRRYLADSDAETPPAAFTRGLQTLPGLRRNRKKP